jgi:hypothetical protein
MGDADSIQHPAGGLESVIEKMRGTARRYRRLAGQSRSVRIRLCLLDAEC